MKREEMQGEVRAVLDTINEAMRRRDAAGALSQHARDAVVYDLAPPLVSEIGTDEAKFQGWMDTWDGPIEQDWRDLKIHTNGDLAICHGLVRTKARQKTSGQVVMFWVRSTLCLVRSSGQWQIVHDHSSVPFYMDGSFRAAVDLEP
ncbi:YybH family protein [Mesorhizobium xinjiangense]|uniref:YybH family protein n=1 Tax=Mesorhizobium xinjiangense TaxID=2678685 RepID=UPI0018DB5319|nr:nuclear transport factor 2 family protein [Mesorhizobium xinjiangense]